MEEDTGDWKPATNPLIQNLDAQCDLDIVISGKEDERNVDEETGDWKPAANPLRRNLGAPGDLDIVISG